MLPRVIKCVTENFVTEDKAKEVEVSGRSLPVVTREGSCCRGSSNVSQKTQGGVIKCVAGLSNVSQKTLSLRTKLRKLRVEVSGRSLSVVTREGSCRRVIKCVTENFVSEDKAKEIEVSERNLSVVTREGSCRRVIKCVTENFVSEDKAKEIEMSGRSLPVITREGSFYRGSSNVSQKTLLLRTKLRKLR